MHAAMRVFDGLTLFMGILAVAYIYLTHQSRLNIEWAGGTALVLSTLLCLLIAGYLHFVNARISTLPEDYEDAEVSDGAGELGFFSPGSIWPFAVASVVVTVGIGLAFTNWWIVSVGAVVLVGAVCGLVFQYYWGPESH